MKFEEFKNEIIRRAKEANACVDEFKRAVNSTNFAELTKVITDNFWWCCNNKVIDVALIEPLNEILLPLGLCTNVAETSCYCIASGSASVRACDSANVRACDSVSVEAYGSASILSFNSIEHKLSDYSICRYRHERIIKYSGDWKIEKAEGKS